MNTELLNYVDANDLRRPFGFGGFGHGFHGGFGRPYLEDLLVWFGRPFGFGFEDPLALALELLFLEVWLLVPY